MGQFVFVLTWQNISDDIDGMLIQNLLVNHMAECVADILEMLELVVFQTTEKY